MSNTWMLHQACHSMSHMCHAHCCLCHTHTHMNAWCHIYARNSLHAYAWVVAPEWMSHVTPEWMSHVTHVPSVLTPSCVNESRHVWRDSFTHDSLSHVTHLPSVLTPNNSFNTKWLLHSCEWVASRHIWKNHVAHINEHVTHMNESCHTWMSHVTRMNESFRTYE